MPPKKYVARRRGTDAMTTRYNDALTAVMLIMASVHAAGAMGFGGTLGLSSSNSQGTNDIKSMWHTFSAHPPVNAPPKNSSFPTPDHSRMLDQSLHCALYSLYVCLLMNDGIDQSQTSVDDEAALRYSLELASAALVLRYVGRWRGLWWTSNRRGPDMYCTSTALSAVAFWLYLAVFALRDTMDYRGLVLKSAAVGWLGMASLQHTDLPNAWFGRTPEKVDRKHTAAGRSMINYIKSYGDAKTYVGVGDSMPPWPENYDINRNRNNPGIGVMKS